MRESELERLCTDLAESMYWVYYKGTGRNGSSDKIYLKCGRGFTVEFKTETGKRSDVQNNERDLLKKRKVPHYLVRNLVEFKHVLLFEEANFTEQEQSYFYGDTE